MQCEGFSLLYFQKNVKLRKYERMIEIRQTQHTTLASRRVCYSSEMVEQTEMAVNVNFTYKRVKYNQALFAVTRVAVTIWKYSLRGLLTRTFVLAIYLRNNVTYFTDVCNVYCIFYSADKLQLLLPSRTSAYGRRANIHSGYSPCIYLPTYTQLPLFFSQEQYLSTPDGLRAQPNAGCQLPDCMGKLILSQ